jgi:hypothetical protein
VVQVLVVLGAFAVVGIVGLGAMSRQTLIDARKPKPTPIPLVTLLALSQNLLLTRLTRSLAKRAILPAAAWYSLIIGFRFSARRAEKPYTRRSASTMLPQANIARCDAE